MKKMSLQFLIIYFSLIIFNLADNILYAKNFTILIDPGHGGEDIGAKNEHVLEKDLSLAIAKKIYQELQKDFQVYLTRSFDRTIGLHDRSTLAEKVQADLFISVHINSGNNAHSHGFETYYLDNHDDVAVKKIEQVENQKLKGDEVEINQILIDLLIERNAPRSKKLAQLVHQNIKKNIQKQFKMSDRGIRPGLFYVLALSKRPAILLEAGFVSNAIESKKLLDPQFQQAYAKAVAEGVYIYKDLQDHNKLAKY